MRGVIVYVDGFNMYHAIHDLRGRHGNHLKWLDLWSLSEKVIGDHEKLVAVKYFSAYATWLEESYRRHQLYVRALKAHGVTDVMGRFKGKSSRCRGTCRERYLSHEEKETDVNIGAHLMADVLKSRCQRALIVSADTDLVPAIKLAQSEAPEGTTVSSVSPPGRMQRNREWPPLFEIQPSKLRGSLLPGLLYDERGEIHRPAEYAPLN